jgi:hypothetical protein
MTGQRDLGIIGRLATVGGLLVIVAAVILYAMAPAEQPLSTPQGLASVRARQACTSVAATAGMFGALSLVVGFALSRRARAIAGATPVPGVAAVAPPPGASVTARLVRLEALKRAGVVTPDEYARKRWEIIGEM